MGTLVFTSLLFLTIAVHGLEDAKNRYTRQLSSKQQSQCNIYQCTTNDKLMSLLEKTFTTLQTKVDKLQDKINSLQQTVQTQQGTLDKLSFKNQNAKGKDCSELYKNGVKLSGVYVIHPEDTQGSVEVYCDMETDGGGWTVFQKRQDGSVDFYRGWDDYKHGFGNLNGEFWLGNDIINRLTNQGKYELRADLEDTTGVRVYARYDFFAITSEAQGYTLSLGAYSGNAGDSMTSHKGYAFRTKDKDNNGCAGRHKGAWWYHHCFTNGSNLNGLYLHGKTGYTDGVAWNTFKGYKYSLKRTEMKIRPVGFKSS